MNILEEAQKIVNGDRQQAYGHPSQDFANIAKMAEPILESDLTPELKHALYMVQVKISRLLNTPEHRDSLVDIAGYVMTYEMILEEER